MAKFNFRDLVFRISPPWLRRFYGERFMGGAIGLTFDLLAEGASQALKAPWLRQSSSPNDALPEIGNERRMTRYAADTDATYRSRLINAWDAWEFAGNEDGGTTPEKGMIGQFADFGLSNVSIVPAVNGDPRVARPGWVFENPPEVEETATFTFDNGSGVGPNTITRSSGSFVTKGYIANMGVVPSGTVSNNNVEYHISIVSPSTLTLYDTDVVNEGPLSCTLDAAWWSRFVVIINQPHSIAASETYGSGDTYGSAGGLDSYGPDPAATIAGIKQLIRQWKPANAINPNFVIVFDGNFYGEPTIEYGDAGLTYDASASTETVSHMT